MILTVLFSLAPAVVPVAPAPALAPRLAPVLSQEDAEVAKRLAEAGEDVPKLLELAQWCESNDKAAEARNVYKRILELDPEHEAAHKALRHHFYDDQWFESYVALSKYKRAEAKRMAEKGLARFGDEWVPQADVPYLRMGWVRTEAGEWVSKAKLDRAAQRAAYVEEGRQLRPEDSTWVAPDDFDKWREGLYLCGGEWLPVEKANEYHSKIGQWWTRQGKYFAVHSTLDDHSTKWAAWYADMVYPDLLRALGKAPEGDEKPEVVVLDSIDQYNTFAGGDQNAGIPPAEATGISSVHYAFFADAWFVAGGAEGNIPEFKGVGVAYWDTKNESLSAFGPFAIRHAAAHSYMEAIDPSWNSISSALSASQPVAPEVFWGEKRIPIWLRFGLASYVERYYNDSEAENPWAYRDWSLDNLRQKGPIRPLAEMFTFTPNVNDIEGSNRWLNEVGFLTSFILDGKSGPVTAAHQAFKKAFAAGEDTGPAVEALQQALLDNTQDLLAYGAVEIAEPGAATASAEGEGN